MTAARAILDHAMSEAELQDAICEMATRLGWRWNHNPDSRRSNPGLPDLILINPEHPEWGPLFLELKVQDPRKGRVRKEQRVWLDTLRTAGQRAWVIRPSDLDFVERLLRGEVE